MVLGVVSRLFSGIEIAGVGFETPIALLGIPLGAILLFYVFFVRRSEVGASRRKKALLFGSRLVIVALLVLVAAQPYTVETTTDAGDARVKMLVDESNSMKVMPNVSQKIASGIEKRGVPVKIVDVGSDNSSKIGDALVSNLQPNGSVLLVSDGQVTGGRSLLSAAEIATSVGATINAINLSATGTEKFVEINGPSKTNKGVEVEFRVHVGGVNIGNSASRLTVTIDGNRVLSKNLQGEATETITHTFDSVGEHTVRAQVSGGGRYSTNNVFFKTVRVVKQPKILYVTQRNYPFQSILNQLYRVDRRSSVPSDLSEYYAVVLQNMPASRIGDISALQEFVIDGNGLVVVGGPSAYDDGGYSSSPISDMVPVKTGKSSKTSKVVIAIDISGSTRGEMSVQQALALDAISQMSGGNQVGVVAFNQNAYQIAALQPLSSNRAEIRRKIRRLENTGATFISHGLSGAEEMLGSSGNVILISDGIANDKQQAFEAARRLGAKGIRIISVGVGGITDTGVMKRIAELGGGTFFNADETNRLRVFFGGDKKKLESNTLTVVNTNHFITQGVKTESNPPRSNRVTVKEGAEYLVASGTGAPAVAAGRYGLGRVVSITVYGRGGTLDGLLRKPDSLLLSRSVNWAIGNPQRKANDVVDVADTRVNQPVKVTYIGDTRPSFENLEFSKTGERQYTATVVPTSKGIKQIGNAKYAVNYEAEYAGFGMNAQLRSAVTRTAGRMFGTGQAGEIAQVVKRKARSPEETRKEWDWLLLVIALVLYMVEVTLRRLQEVYGYTLSERVSDAVNARL